MTEDFTPPAVVDAEVVAGPVTVEGEPSLPEPKDPPKEATSLFEFFKLELAEGKIDFALRAAETEDGHIYFYIHPQGKDGRTGDFYVDNSSPNRVIKVAAPGPLKGAPADEAVVLVDPPTATNTPIEVE